MHFIDLGRPRFAHFGMPRSGACDRESLITANRLVGNPDGAVGFELVLTGGALLFHTPAVVAVTGADADVELTGSRGGEPVPFGEAVAFEEPFWMVVGRAKSCVRTYVAIRGMVEVRPFLGSIALAGRRDLTAHPTAGLGVFEVVEVTDTVPRIAGPVAPVSPVESLGIERGPHSIDASGRDLFADLVAARWTVSPQSDSSGVRLESDSFERSAPDGLAMRSFGLPYGAVQLPPGGQPIVMGVDQPTTGGYPVVAVVAPDQLDLVGRLRPGGELRLVEWPASGD